MRREGKGRPALPPRRSPRRRSSAGFRGRPAHAHAGRPEHAQRAARQGDVAGVCRRERALSRFLKAQGACAAAGHTRFVTGAGALRRSGTAAPLGWKEGGGEEKKKPPPQSYVRKRRLCTRGDPYGAGSPRNGRETRPLLTLSAASRAPPAAPLGASFHGSPARAAAAAVIPSILNLTSSHTRDEVIEGNARHVRSSPIGRRGSGGRGAGAAGEGGGERRLRGDPPPPPAAPPPAGSAAGGGPRAGARGRAVCPSARPRGGGRRQTPGSPDTSPSPVRVSLPPPPPPTGNGLACAGGKLRQPRGKAGGGGGGGRSQSSASPPRRAAGLGPVTSGVRVW